jgi:hypothetical protein
MDDHAVLLPRARQQGLIVSELGAELLVYDLERHRAHRLNATAAAVWRACRNTQTDEAAASHVSSGLPLRARCDVVWLAVGRLSRAGLLAEPAVRAPRLSRRRLLRLLGQAALLPVVVSIVAPTPAAAATCLPSGSACTSNSQCCSDVCLPVLQCF